MRLKTSDKVPAGNLEQNPAGNLGKIRLKTSGQEPA
jgi:hypothetical protein